MRIFLNADTCVRNEIAIFRIVPEVLLNMSARIYSRIKLTFISFFNFVNISLKIKLCVTHFSKYTERERHILQCIWMSKQEKLSNVIGLRKSRFYCNQTEIRIWNENLL